jgi:hypothetical protein
MVRGDQKDTSIRATAISLEDSGVTSLLSSHRYVNIIPALYNGIEVDNLPKMTKPLRSTDFNAVCYGSKFMSLTLLYTESFFTKRSLLGNNNFLEFFLVIIHVHKVHCGISDMDTV